MVYSYLKFQKSHNTKLDSNLLFLGILSLYFVISTGKYYEKRLCELEGIKRKAGKETCKDSEEVTGICIIN